MSFNKNAREINKNMDMFLLRKMVYLHKMYKVNMWDKNQKDPQ